MAQYGVIDGKATIEIRPRVRDGNGDDTAKGNPVEMSMDEFKELMVPEQAAFPDITGTPTESNFNDLLASLRAAGIIASS